MSPLMAGRFCFCCLFHPPLVIAFHDMSSVGLQIMDFHLCQCVDQVDKETLKVEESKSKSSGIGHTTLHTIFLNKIVQSANPLESNVNQLGYEDGTTVEQSQHPTSSRLNILPFKEITFRH